MGVVAGMSEITSRSLLTANEQHVTLLYKSAGKLQRGGPVFDFLRNCVDGGHVESVRGMRLLQDGTGAVFDVPKEYAIDFVDKCGGDSGDSAASNQEQTLTIAEALPELQALPDRGLSLIHI